MRCLSMVIDRMLEYVPEGNPLVEELRAVQESTRYRAPEEMRDLWGRGGEVLYEAFGCPVPHEGWEGKIMDIWMGGA